MFRSDKKDAVLDPVYRQLGNIKGLGHRPPVERNTIQLAERAGTDVGRRQNGFRRIQSRAPDVVVLREHICLPEKPRT